MTWALSANSERPPSAETRGGGRSLAEIKYSHVTELSLMAGKSPTAGAAVRRYASVGRIAFLEKGGRGYDLTTQWERRGLWGRVRFVRRSRLILVLSWRRRTVHRVEEAEMKAAPSLVLCSSIHRSCGSIRARKDVREDVVGFEAWAFVSTLCSFVILLACLVALRPGSTVNVVG
ncbi:hypothetical protein DFP72DRAFT_843252 [Ephemerocybe angulata]|uniref:Uncharacterized protein n=1 Tax=Ephemerocybe angulata TaxID=980116 RepID=A0A8H6MAD9_9AGAR|nr:hypothetical protein DFP72DRAFT_843252 [Tulosesus angulatus]